MKAVVRIAVLLGAIAAVAAAGSPSAGDQAVLIRGRAQTVHLYGSRGSGDPVLVSSGDGGWIHLGPQVAETLAANGFFVVGFDTKAYLESFTAGATTLRLEDEPGDYGILAEYTARGSTKKPILIGVSEGAGLSVLAATDRNTARAIAGIVALGLPKVSELGWRWKDSLIYVTHQVPKEPTFTTASVVPALNAMPLATIQSTGDEFVPVADVRTILESAREPKRLWVVEATDHRFSGNLQAFQRSLFEAIDWVRQQPPH
jgi:type IV secretory pathway VirJ component